MITNLEDCIDGIWYLENGQHKINLLGTKIIETLDIKIIGLLKKSNISHFKNFSNNQLWTIYKIYMIIMLLHLLAKWLAIWLTCARDYMLLF